MLKVNDKVLYGLNGVCTIVDIKKLPMMSRKEEGPDYYFLSPIGSRPDHIIYVPVDKVQTENNVMRALLSGKELEDFLKKISEIEPLTIRNEKLRRDEYKQAMLELTPEKCVSVIKSVRLRKSGVCEHRKNISETDLEFEKLALKTVCSELSCVLEISVEEAEYMVDDAL